VRALIFLVLVGCGGSDFSSAESPETEAGQLDATAPLVGDAWTTDAPKADADARPVETAESEAGAPSDGPEVDAEIVEASIDAEILAEASADVIATAEAGADVEVEDAPPPLVCITMSGFDCSGPTWRFKCCQTSPCTCCNRSCEP
jgi:hypothetical protein